jgi:hypothetical protein
MAICMDCHREMLVAASCDVKAIQRVGVVYGLELHASHRSAADPTARCPDRCVRPGVYHHLGCDVTRDASATYRL